MHRHSQYHLRPALMAVLVLGLLASAGCTTLAFWTVNARAKLGHYDTHPNQPYGPTSRQRLDVYQPRDQAGPHPAVIFIHGGGWNSGNKQQYQFVGAALAEAGVTAFIPNYSLYPDRKFPAFMDDIAQSIVWVARHADEYGVDARQIYLVGHSAGAHIATLVSLDPRYLQAIGGDANLIRGVVGLAGPYDFYPFKYAYMNDLFGTPEQVFQSQPVNFARADAPPMLLLHGLKDTTVDPRNTVQLSNALRASGAQVQDIYYPDASHSDLVAGFSPFARQRVPVLDTVLAFIKQTALPTCDAQLRKSSRCSVGTQ